MDSTQKGAQLGSSKGLTVCPYDNTLQISDEELAAHLENCRRVDHKVKFANCEVGVRYACRHCLELVYAPEVAIHEQSCLQKFLISLQQLACRIERPGNTDVATDKKKTPTKRKAREIKAQTKIRKVTTSTSAEVKKSSRRTRQTTKTKSEVVAEDYGQVEKVLVANDKQKPLKRLQARNKKGTKARKYSKKTTGKTKQNDAESGGVQTEGESKFEVCEKEKSKAVFVCNLNIPRFNFRRFERENE